MTIGAQTRSVGAPAKNCGRNRWSRSSAPSRSAPQHPQNAATGTVEPQPAQVLVGTVSEVDVIVILSAMDLVPTPETQSQRYHP
jgi:hypothetical protein